MPMQQPYQELGLAARPFVTFTLKPNFKSATVSTGPQGFREHYTEEGTPIDLRMLRSRYAECRVLLGGSVAFGIGASSDRTTMAALLSRPQLPFVNLGVSGAGCAQELAYYLSLRHLLPEVRDVVLFSGFAECVHAGLKEASVFHPFGGTVLGPQRCDPAPGRLRRLAGAGRTRQKAAREWDQAQVEDNLLAPELLDSRLAGTLERAVRNMEIWRALADSLRLRVHYVLQPAIGWTPKKLTGLEQENWEHDQVHLGAAVRWLASQPVYRRAKDELSAGAAAAGLDFHDANDWIAEGYDDTSIFIDVAHFYDEGQRVLASRLEKHLDWK
ncbi:hypothetical protein [Amycolatopsis silviterrae]|uniref:SGNH/GDSL hydrolase family protein n=1 Tax=Amycolatopsis silviterrae TaxID=1656914 RepID=A0ABW5HGH8_9PSEU